MALFTSFERLLLVAVTGGLIHSNLACQCAREHLQSKICAGNVLLKVKILSLSKAFTGPSLPPSVPFPPPPLPPVTGDRNFQATIQRVYRDESGRGFNKGQSIILTTPSPGQCQAPLTLNSYLISGVGVDAGTVRATLCDYHKVWSTIAKSEKRRLRKRLAQNCQCQIKLCRSRSGCDSSLPCTFFETEGNSFSCFSRYSYCKDGQDGCQWSRNRQLKQCLSA